MVTTTPIPPNSYLRIEGTQVTPTTQEVLSIGDIVRVTVRERAPDGSALLYMRGTLLRAAVPENVVAGNILLTQVNDTGNHLGLKILEILDGASPGSTLSTPTSPENAFRQLLTSLGSDLQKLLSQSRSLGETPKELPLKLSTLLETIHSNLASVTTPLLPSEDGPLSNELPLNRSLQTLLPAISNLDRTLQQAGINAQGSGAVLPQGLTSQLLRSIATELRSAFPMHDSLWVTHFLSDLDTTLRNSLAQGGDDATARIMRDVMKTLGRETERFRGRDAALHGRLTEQLALLTESDTAPDANVTQQLLSTINRSLSERISQKGNSYDTALISARIASQLEQLASTYELLDQLSPVMENLGEPLFLLLPFLFQGFLYHVELTRDNPRKGLRVGDEESNKKHDEDGDGNERLHLTVPLPHLGDVAVELVRRAVDAKTQEISVRLSLEESAGTQFLSEHLHELRDALERNGFTITDLMAETREPIRNIPEWVLTFQSSTSVLA